MTYRVLKREALNGEAGSSYLYLTSQVLRRRASYPGTTCPISSTDACTAPGCHPFETSADDPIHARRRPGVIQRGSILIAYWISWRHIRYWRSAVVDPKLEPNPWPEWNS